MGGVAKAATGLASDAVGVTTAGIVDLEKGKINLNPKDAAKNWGESATGSDTMKSLQPEIPKPPTAEDPTAQAARAKAEAEAKTMKEIGEKGRGLSSTVLGGSTSTDNTILQKKKLLGE